ncbi:folylpolyglutamate synthase [[Candida] jaroonii]|uniref:Folylpolyglutamate synthase n=1 Tax=[Candida] jaroonii TaxID=467808 RepID=A0ACA9Y2N4_9ASCO|nr:folylpolyglutamate synthase [[Candida] jaroonii]
MDDMKPRTYKDAINALNSLQSNFQSLEAKRLIGPSVDKNEYSIKTVYEYIRRLGYKPNQFNKLNIIHVTGTKGKGSTCAFTESILLNYRFPQLNNGIKKVGLFTSPHLKSVRERIRINGQPIEEVKFTKYFFEVWDKLSTTTSDLNEFPDLEPCDKVKPMYFKYLTVLSYHIFMSEGVDTAIYEVGVGGKYDSTNVVEKPTVTGVSALGIDHVAMLGNTIESIAWNKTGIFKPDTAAFVSKQLQYPEIHKFIEDRAEELKTSSLEFVNDDKLDTPLGLLGSFQRQNAALACKLAAKHLQILGITEDLPNEDLTYLPELFKKGLKETKWDGRCQIIPSSRYPNFPDITWYIDGAHTKESIDVASEWIKNTLTSSKPKVLIFNQQGRDTADELLKELYNNLNGHVQFDYIIFCTNITWSTGYNAELVSMNNSKDAIDQLIVQKGFEKVWKELDNNSHQPEIKIFKEIELSLNFIKDLNKSLEVFVCGSLHLVGGVLSVLDNDRD